MIKALLVLLIYYLILKIKEPKKWKQDSFAPGYVLIVGLIYFGISFIRYSNPLLYNILFGVIFIIVIGSIYSKIATRSKEKKQYLNQEVPSTTEIKEEQPVSESFEPKNEFKNESMSSENTIEQEQVQTPMSINDKVDSIVADRGLNSDWFYNPSFENIVAKEKTTAEDNINKLQNQFQQIAHYYKEIETFKTSTDVYNYIFKRFNHIKKLTAEINSFKTIDLINNNRTINSFEHNLRKSKIRQVLQGSEGEERIKKVLLANGIPKDCILSDVNLPFNYHDTDSDENSTHNNNQMDLIVFLEQGIFILEVKAYSTKHMKIYSNGRNNYGENNFLDQMRNHRKALKQALYEKGNDISKIETILVNANPKTIIEAPSNIKVWNIDDVYENMMKYRKRIDGGMESVYSSVILAKSNRHIYRDGLPERENDVLTTDFMNEIYKMNAYEESLEEVSGLIQKERGHNN